MNLIEYLQAKKFTPALFVQLRNLFQGLLTGSLNPVVAFVMDALPDDLVDQLSGPLTDERNKAVADVVNSDASGPELTVEKIIRAMNIHKEAGEFSPNGLTKETEILWAAQAVLYAGKNNFVETIVSPILPTELGLVFWGWVQIGSKALKLPGVSGQVVNVRLDDVFAQLLSEKRAALPKPTPPPGPPHQITSPYKGEG